MISPIYVNITIPSPKGQNELFKKFHEFLKEKKLVNRELQAFGREDVLVSLDHDQKRFRVETPLGYGRFGAIEYSERFRGDMWKVLDKLVKYGVLQYAGTLPDSNNPTGRGNLYHTYLLRVPIDKFIEVLEDTSTPESKS